jgi:hypothetical protein
MNKKKRVIYIIASLRNKNAPIIANKLRKILPNAEIFDGWAANAPRGDDQWISYSKRRGLTYLQALKDYPAQLVFNFDKLHLDRCTDAVLIQKAGRSCHTEFGYILGQKKRGYILLEKELPRWDVMLNFATGIFKNFSDLVKELKKYDKK